MAELQSTKFSDKSAVTVSSRSNQQFSFSHSFLILFVLIFCLFLEKMLDLEVLNLKNVSINKAPNYGLHVIIYFFS